MKNPQPLDHATASRLSSQKRSDTRPEQALRRELWRRGFRYSLQRPIPQSRRTIDIALVRYRVAVFVDGCFWHRCPTHGSTPKNNIEWWTHKLESNRRRDLETNQILKSQGWKVVRVWEHETANSAADRIERVVHGKAAR